MAVSRKFGVFEIDEGGGQVTLGSGKTLSADQVTEGTNKFVTAAQKANLDNIVSRGRKNLWTDGALKYWLERTTITDPATNVYGSTLIQVKHLKASGTRGTMTVARQALTAGVSSADYAIRVGTSGADSSLDADSYYLIRHYIYQGTRNHSNGEKLTVSFKVASSVAGQKIGVVVRQNYGTTGSPSAEEILTGEIFTLASGENEISKTFTTNSLTGKTFGTDNNDCLIVDIVVQCGSTIATSLFGGSAFGFTEATTLDFYEFGTYEGEVDYPFVATDDIYIIEKNSYQKSYNKNVLPGTASDYNGIYSDFLYFSATNAANFTLPLKNRMVKTPVITFYAYNGTSGNITITGGTYAIDTVYSTSENNVCRGLAVSEKKEEWADIYVHFVADARY
jgi:hypothetical protein